MSENIKESIQNQINSSSMMIVNQNTGMRPMAFTVRFFKVVFVVWRSKRSKPHRAILGNIPTRKESLEVYAESV